MSREQLLESSTTPDEQAQRDEHVVGRRFYVGAPIPLVLTKDELAAITRYSIRQIDTFRAAKNHPGIRELDGPGQPRFCGRTVKAWLDAGAPQPMRRPFFSLAKGRR